MIKTDDMRRLMSADIDVKTAKRMAVAVIERALDDYKKYPTERAAIEKWILSGDVWIDLMFPDTDNEVILEGFRRYAKIDSKTETA